MRNVQRAFAAAALALAATATAAQAQPKLQPDAFLVEPKADIATGSTWTAPIGAILFKQTIRAARAVRLSEGLEARVIDPLIQTGSKLDVPAGAILPGATSRPDVYCYLGPAKTWMTTTGACFIDADQDKKFETIASGYCAAVDPDFMVVIPDNHTLCGMTLKKKGRKALPTPIPYEAVDPALGPTATIAVRWGRVLPPKNRAGAPTKLALTLLASDRPDEGGGVFLTLGFFDLEAGDRGVVDVAGGKLNVLGFEPTGALRFRLDAPIPAQPLQFEFRDWQYRAPIIIYY